MKILYINREDAFAQSGGDTVQMMKTKGAVEKLGGEIDVITSGTPEYERYDLIHCFNIQNPGHTLSYVREALKANKPVVVSTIYWNLDNIYRDDFLTNPRFSRTRRLLGKHLGLAFVNVYLHRLHSRQAQILKLASALLPNSIAEKNKLLEDFHCADAKFYPIPNAVDPQDFAEPRPETFQEQYGVRNYVLCVARFQGVKNQLNVIRAMKGMDIPLVLIGNVGEEGYARECRHEAEGGNVLFIPFLPHETLKNAYAGARCHVLASLRETPGLSSLEAGVCGCPIVSGTVGSQEEYFGRYATYCDPYNVDSIRNAIGAALETPQENRAALRERILARYTWEQAANATMEAYRHVFEQNPA
ncbi:MAG: glycosyltransferase family 4 protein [bacterium]